MGTSATPSQDPELGFEPNNQPTWGSGWMTHVQHHHRLHLWTVGPTRPNEVYFGHFFYIPSHEAEPGPNVQSI